MAGAEAAAPAQRVAAEFADHTLQGRASVTFGHLPDALLELRFGRGGDGPLALVRLKPHDIHSQRMLIRVDQGKPPP